MKNYLFLLLLAFSFFANAQMDTIHFSDCLTRSINATSQLRTFKLFNVAKEDIIIIRVAKTASSAVRPCVKLYFPGNPDPNTSGCSNAFVQDITFSALDSGTYTITVQDFSGFNTGDFSIYVERGNRPIGAQNITCNVPVSFQIDCLPEMVTWKFAAQPNSLIAVNANSTSSVRACLVVRDSLGAILGADIENQFNASLTFTSSGSPGYYYVFVFDYTAAFTGGVNFTVSPITGDCITLHTHNPVEALALTAFPNPTTGVLQIQAQNPFSGKLEMALLGPTGQQLRKFWMNGQSIDLDLSDLPDGFYALRISDGEKTGMIRVALLR